MSNSLASGVSPEDKAYWCARGEQEELVFVQSIAHAHGLNATINPMKAIDPFAPDLLVDVGLADLKTQRTPFFTARRRYRFDPQFTVTLNVGDVGRYTGYGDDFAIFFWVRWDTLERSFGGRSYAVRPLEGIWQTSAGEVCGWVESGRAVPHRYRNRTDDTRGNARDSYLLDLGWMTHLPHVFSPTPE